MTINLFNFRKFVSDTLSRGPNINIMYTDLPEKFDKINHQILFTKLKLTDICDFFLCWINFFIEDIR